MTILVDITHPAHVHFFRHAITAWQEHGHRVVIASREKDLAVGLLDRLELPHQTLSSAGHGTFGLARELAVRGLRLWQLIRRERVDVAVAIGGTFVAPAAKLAGVPALVFTDTEHAKLANAIAFSCAAAVVTPTCYRNEVKSRHITYEGYHELAYLHPRLFEPDPSVLEPLGVAAGEKFVVMRFVGWGASHDAGHAGIALEMKRRAATEFAEFARVFITSEAPLPGDLDRFRIRIPPEQIHHALYHASLLYGESATMASECAVLGTPAIFLDDDGRGYTDEQERRYGAVFNFTESVADQERSITRGLELLKAEDSPEIREQRRQRILADRIDVTAWMVDLVENWEGVSAGCAE